jgi:hypothetical protein
MAVNKPWKAPPQSVRKKLPDSYFLLPSQKKFPIKEWRGVQKGQVNINALRSALRLARMHGYKQVAAKAERLLNSYKKSKS